MRKQNGDEAADLCVVFVFGSRFDEADELAAAAEVDERVDRRLTFRLSLDIIRHVATVSVAHRTWLQLHTTLEASYRRNRLVQET